MPKVLNTTTIKKELNDILRPILSHEAYPAFSRNINYVVNLQDSDHKLHKAYVAELKKGELSDDVYSPQELIHRHILFSANTQYNNIINRIEDDLEKANKKELTPKVTALASALLLPYDIRVLSYAVVRTLTNDGQLKPQQYTKNLKTTETLLSKYYLDALNEQPLESPTLLHHALTTGDGMAERETETRSVVKHSQLCALAINPESQSYDKTRLKGILSCKPTQSLEREIARHLVLAHPEYLDHAKANVHAITQFVHDTFSHPLFIEQITQNANKTLNPHDKQIWDMIANGNLPSPSLLPSVTSDEFIPLFKHVENAIQHVTPLSASALVSQAGLNYIVGKVAVIPDIHQSLFEAIKLPVESIKRSMLADDRLNLNPRKINAIPVEELLNMAHLSTADRRTKVTELMESTAIQESLTSQRRELFGKMGDVVNAGRTNRKDQGPPQR